MLDANPSPKPKPKVRILSTGAKVPFKARLNKTLIDGLPITGDRYDVRDTEVSGLMLRVGAKDKTWALQREQHGRTFKRSLGNYADMSVTAAREAALELKGAIRTGKIHAPELPANLGSLLDWYVDRSGLAPRTQQDIRTLRLRFTKPFETLPLDKIGKPTIAALLDPIESNNTHNQLRGYLHAAFKLIGERSEILNPVTIPAREVGEGGPVIEDLAAWWSKCAQEGNPQFRLCRALTLLSGMRGGEARALRRGWVRDDRIVIPRATMLKAKGRGKPDYIVPLSPPMQKIAKEALRHGSLASSFLFPGTGKGGFISIKADNGHECRRTYYSTCLKMGVPSEIRKKLMDHTLSKVDAAYFSDSLTWTRVVETQNAISQQLLGGLDFNSLFGL